MSPAVSPVVHSPTKHKHARSPSPCHLWSSSSSSGRGPGSGHRSRQSSLSSSGFSGSGSRSGQGSGSCGRSPAQFQASGHEESVHSGAASDGSVEVLSTDEVSGGEEDVLDSANEADVSQGSMSLLYISNADDEDTHKCKACKLTHKNDTDFAAWRDKLIRDGVAGIQEQDKTVHDYADPGKKKPKNPDMIRPPISYMKECRVFQPLPSTTNPLGLCHFYPTDPASLSTLASPKARTTVDHINNLLVLVKSQYWPYIIVVFEGGPIMPLGLLQELHSCHTLVHIPIFLPKETKDRHKPGYHVAHSVPKPSKMICHSSTTSSTPIIM